MNENHYNKQGIDNLKKFFSILEENAIINTLNKKNINWDVDKAAKFLGISKTMLISKMSLYNITQS